MPRSEASPSTQIAGTVQQLGDFDVAITGDHSRLEHAVGAEKLLSAPRS